MATLAFDGILLGQVPVGVENNEQSVAPLPCVVALTQSAIDDVRVIALAKVQGPAAALAAIEPLAQNPSLRRYYLLPAVRGGLLVDSGDRQAAAACFREALERPCSEPERRFLRRKLAECQTTAT